MTAKKTITKPAADVAEDVVEETPEVAAPTAEEIREAQLADDELLEDMPELRGPHQLRLRHRNRIMRMVVALKDHPGMTGRKATEELTAEQIEVFLDLSEEIDDFAESIAVDKEAYVAWAEKAELNHMLAIMNRYSVALGE